MKKTITILVALAAASAPALAARQVAQSHPASRDGRVQIELCSGVVDVLGWDRAEVRIEGRIGEDAGELEVRESDGRVIIELPVPPRDGTFRGDGTRLEIRVPSASDVEIESVSGDLSITGVTGAVTAESVSGAVRVEGDPSEAELSSVSGDVRIRSSRPLRRGEFQTVSGAIDFDSALDADGRFAFESVSGDVTLRLPADVSGDFRVETFSGGIDNQFGPAARKTSPYLPAMTLSFTTGSGGARISAESFSGQVKLLRK